MKREFKANNILMLCLVALTTWCFYACDDDPVGGKPQMGGEPLLGFPADTVFEAIPGDEVKVPFNVGYDWNITSNKDWCKIDGEYKNARGKAGNNTVTFVVSELGDLFAADTAAITLHMNKDKRIIAHIIRYATKEYTLSVKEEDVEYADGESIVIGMNGQQVLNLALNFSVDQLRYEFPEWIKMERKANVVTLNVVEESLKYVINNIGDSLCFYKDSTLRRNFHVQYVGMDPREIRIDSKPEDVLIVSRDATRATIGGEKYAFPLNFTITALNDKYQIISLSYEKSTGYKVLPEGERWFTINDIKGEVQLSVKSENKDLYERTAHLFAVPQLIADSLENDEAVIDYFYEEVDSLTKLREAAEPYCMVVIAQDGEANITITPEAQWGVKVTSDGEGYFDVIKGDTCYTPMEVTIETYRGYEFVCASQDNNGYSIVPLEDSWLDIEDDKQGNVNISFEANDGNERTLYLFALPLPIIESLDAESLDYQEKLYKKLFEEVDSIVEMKVDAEMFFVAKFVQDANESSAIKVYKNSKDGWASIDVTKETNVEWLEIAANPNDSLKGVAPNKVFHCDMLMGMSYIINPLLALDEWGGSGFQEDARGIEVYGKSGKKYNPKEKDYTEDYGIMEEIEGNYMLVTFTGSYKKIKEDFIVYFINRERKCLKALVVTAR